MQKHIRRLLLVAAVAALVIYSYDAYASKLDAVGSFVRVRYPEVPGAPVIQTVRVMWSGDRLVGGDMHPGEEVSGLMYPTADDVKGGGPMTILRTVDGHQFVWEGRIGREGDDQRYGVDIQFDPIGGVALKHCVHPCAAAIRPWYEPWWTGLRNLARRRTAG